MAGAVEARVIDRDGQQFVVFPDGTEVPMSRVQAAMTQQADYMPPPRADAAFTPTVPTAGSSYQFGDVGRDAGNEALQAAYAQLADAVNPQSRNLLDVATNYATGTAGGLLSGAIGLGQKAGGYAADVLGAGAEALGSDRWSRGGAAQALYGDMQAGGQAAGLGTEANALGLLSELGAGKYARGAIADRLNQPGPVPTMYSNPIAGLLGDASKKDAGFDVVRKDASNIFGAGTERVRYTDPKSGGTMEVVVRPDGSASVLELEVPETSRGKGIGQSLQERVMQDFPVMGGQVSSKAAATTAYRLGRRPVGKPNATLKDVFAEMDDMSSVNMVSPQMQALRMPTDPAAVRGAEVMDMLKSGRGSEVTDQMLDMGDPVLNARLNEYLYRNYDLPMDAASRMQRAGEIGFDTGTPLYHGTGADFTGFDSSFRGGVADAFSARRADWLTDSPVTAEGYANMAAREAPVARLIKQSEAADRAGRFGEAEALMRQAEMLEANMPNAAGQKILPTLTPKPFTGIDAQGGSVNDLEWPMRDKLAEAKAANDYGVELQNFADHPDWSIDDPALHRGIFDPRNIRSRFSRFDPRLSHLKNLSASIGAGLLGANMMPDRGNQQ